MYSISKGKSDASERLRINGQTTDLKKTLRKSAFNGQPGRRKRKLNPALRVPTGPFYFGYSVFLDTLFLLFILTHYALFPVFRPFRFLIPFPFSRLFPVQPAQPRFGFSPFNPEFSTLFKIRDTLFPLCSQPPVTHFQKPAARRPWAGLITKRLKPITHIV
jgi:hypothetical protein